jgi:hypothetical protein
MRANITTLDTATASQATITEGSDYVELSNNYLQFSFDKSNGWLYSFVDKQTSVDFVVDKSASPLLFSFWTDYGGYFNPNYFVNSVAAQSFSYSAGSFSGGVELDMEWDQFNVGHVFDINVYVAVKVFDNNPLSDWTIRLANHDTVAITFVNFPVITGLGQISSNPLDDYFTFPALSGQLYEDPVHNFVTGVGWMQLYPGGFQNMQFTSYYSIENHAGLYLAAYDTHGYTKFLSIGKPVSPNWLILCDTFIPSFVSGADVTLPYEMVLGVFHGDWYTAAQIYRGWALKQWWARSGPVSTRADIPGWFKKTAVMADVFTRYWEHDSSLWDGPFSNVPLIAESMRSTFGSSPLLFWRGWEKNGWYVGGQDIFPPSEGWASFDNAVQKTHLNGGHIFVMEPTSGYDEDAAGWATAQEHATVDQNGNYYAGTGYPIDNTGHQIPQTYAIMNPDSYWMSILLNMTKTLATHRVDFLMLDGNPITPQLDFSTQHSNPLGGGNWWFSGYQAIFSTLRTEARKINSNFVFGSEWCAEVYIPYIDACNDETSTGFNPMNIGGGTVRDQSLVSFIPLWQAVYHDYTMTYPTFGSINGRDAPFYQRGLGLDLIWGETIMVDMDPQGTGPPYKMSLYSPKMVNYAKEISTARNGQAYSSLVLGKMLGPLSISSPTITIPATQAPIPYTGELVPAFTSPSVLGSAWQTPDGTIAIILTNISGYQVTATVDLSSLPISDIRYPLTSLKVTLMPLSVYTGSLWETYHVSDLAVDQHNPMTFDA